MNNYSNFELAVVNCGSAISIIDAARLIAKAVGFECSIGAAPAKPAGTPRKLVSYSKFFSMGLKPHVPPEKGMAASYQCFCHTEGQA